MIKAANGRPSTGLLATANDVSASFGSVRQCGLLRIESRGQGAPSSTTDDMSGRSAFASVARQNSQPPVATWKRLEKCTLILVLTVVLTKLGGTGVGTFDI